MYVSYFYSLFLCSYLYLFSAMYYFCFFFLDCIYISVSFHYVLFFVSFSWIAISHVCFFQPCIFSFFFHFSSPFFQVPRLIVSLNAIRKYYSITFSHGTKPAKCPPHSISKSSYTLISSAKICPCQETGLYSLALSFTFPK